MLSNRRHISCLLNELLMMIFIEGYYGVDLTKLMGPVFCAYSYTPRVLFTNTIAAVCTRWRAIALSLPVLWSSVSYRGIESWEDEEDFDTESTGKFQMMNVLLERSKHASLEVGLSFDHFYSEWPTAMTAIYPHLRRCRSLGVDIDFAEQDFDDSSDVDKAIACIFPLPGKLDRLEDLSICLFCPPQEAGFLFDPLKFCPDGACPRLRRFRISGDDFPTDYGSLPLQDITSLRGTFKRDSESAEFLRDFSSLRELWIDPTTPNPPEDPDMPLVVPFPSSICANLRSLTLDRGDLNLFGPCNSPLEELTLVCRNRWLGPDSAPERARLSDKDEITQTIWPHLRTLTLSRWSHDFSLLNSPLIMTFGLRHQTIQHLRFEDHCTPPMHPIDLRGLLLMAGAVWGDLRSVHVKGVNRAIDLTTLATSNGSGVKFRLEHAL